MSDTVDGLFLSALERHPLRPFLRHLTPATDDRLTYADAARRIAAVVAGLQGLGFEPGDRVVCYAEEMRASFLFTLACAHAGVTMVPLSPAFSVPAVARLVERLGARGVFTSPAHAPRLLEGGVAAIAFDDAALPKGVQPVNATPSGSAAEAVEALRRAAAGHQGDDLYVMLPTSGTTGEPKLPARTHRAAALRGPRIATRLGMRPEDPSRVLLVAALTHSFGHSIVATGLSVGTEFCIPAEIDARASLDEVRALDPTHIFGTPRVLRAFHDQQRKRGGEPGQRLFGPSARVMRSGPLDEADLRGLQEQGLDVGEIYGCSECGTMVVTPLNGWRPGYAGTALPGISLRIADDSEILINCDGETVRYFGEEQLTREATGDDGFYRSGDCGELTTDGYLRIHGRKRDVFNTHEGSNVYPQRIEAMIETLPAVQQVVLVGDQRPHFGALIVLEEDPTANQGDSQRAADGYLDEERFPGAYERMGAHLAGVNRKLESIERVKRFALFARPMAPELYTLVQAGRVRRARAAIQAAYRERIEALYSPAPSKASLVPD